MAIRLWRRLSLREAGRSVSSLLTRDVTESLEKRLRAWIEEAIYPQDLSRIALRLDIPEAIDNDMFLYHDGFIDGDDLYNVVDAILAMESPKHHQIELQEILDDALSEYTISPDGLSLENRASRVEIAAWADASATIRARADAGSAADHLAAAWDKAFSGTPDFSKSYSESIKAVEAAAHAIIEPNNHKATLGTMIGHLRSHPKDFCLMLPEPGVDVSPAIGMMSALWSGQTSRHAGQNPTRPETCQEARAALHLAIALVQWFSSGTVRVVPIKPPAADQP